MPKKTRQNPAPLHPVKLQVAPTPAYNQGDEVVGSVNRKRSPNNRLLFVSVPDWPELALAHIPDASLYKSNERLALKFFRVRPDGVLEFAGPSKKTSRKLT